jgi:hypothetical protein
VFVFDDNSGQTGVWLLGSTIENQPKSINKPVKLRKLPPLRPYLRGWQTILPVRYYGLQHLCGGGSEALEVSSCISGIMDCRIRQVTTELNANCELSRLVGPEG